MKLKMRTTSGVGGLVVLLAVVIFAVVVARPGRSEAEENCAAWELSAHDASSAAGESAGRPVIDRIASEEPYGQLLVDWIADDCMRMNHVQVVGTHNSYHLKPYGPLLDVIALVDPNAALSFEYSHRTLTEQLDVLAVRQLELDVFADPGPAPLYAAPIGEALVTGKVPIPAMLGPGEKVLHIQDIDYRSTCLTLHACLAEIASWSAAHPNHLPLMVLIEAKDDPLVLPPEIPGVGPIPPPTEPVQIGAAELQSIDQAIRAVFGPSQLITPDDVRGSRDTLEEAVLRDGWPTLNEARGRVFFALDNRDNVRDAYVAGHPSLRGRVMFTSSEPGSAEAAFVQVADPIANHGYIQELVADGYIVRTRADADTLEARLGLTARRDAAFSSGAQLVSTDYPEPDPDLGTGYSVALESKAAGRCNPVLAPPGCQHATFEDGSP